MLRALARGLSRGMQGEPEVDQRPCAGLRGGSSLGREVRAHAGAHGLARQDEGLLRAAGCQVLQGHRVQSLELGCAVRRAATPLPRHALGVGVAEAQDREAARGEARGHVLEPGAPPVGAGPVREEDGGALGAPRVPPRADRLDVRTGRGQGEVGRAHGGSVHSALARRAGRDPRTRARTGRSPCPTHPARPVPAGAVRPARAAGVARACASRRPRSGTTPASSTGTCPWAPPATRAGPRPT